MKKHLTSILSFAVTMLMAFTASFTLTSCGEEVSIDGPGGSEEGMTVFASVADNTRTTIDTDAAFYWQSETVSGVVTNDQIWIDEAGNGASFSLQSASSEFEGDMLSGKFYFRAALNKPSYKLSYTGFGSSTGDKVTISAEQQQSKWNNSDHIGKSGDCATATAIKQSNGNYSFTLEHKASYLIFQPFAPAATATNIYQLTEIELVDEDGNALAGTFPLKYDGLKTNGAENTSNQIRLTCALGFELPTAAKKENSVYAVMLPRGAAEGGRKLRVAYKIHSSNDGDFIVYYDISDKYEANGARLFKHKISVPVPDPNNDPNFISDGSGTFGGTKFKPAFLRRTDGNATTGATLELAEMKADPFILLQYNQGAQRSDISEFQKRMWFTWNELAEIFGHADQGQGASWANTTATAANITNSVTIPTNGGKQYRMPIVDEYARLVETPNSGRATVNYYPASYAAVIVDLSGDATYASKGWSRTAPWDANVNAAHIAGYLFFPDESIILASKIQVASMNGRWNTTASNLTADELREFVNHGCMFLPAAGFYNGTSWISRGSNGSYWTSTIRTNGPIEALKFGIDGATLASGYFDRSTYFAIVLVEN